MSTTSVSKVSEKYGLRPRTLIKRLQQEKNRVEASKKCVKNKPRPAPLSKYRRKTANARERHRMREINTAFESLRKALPDAYEAPISTNCMTKITTLRLAVDYIQALSEVLNDESTDSNFYSFSPQQMIEDNKMLMMSENDYHHLNHQHPQHRGDENSTTLSIPPSEYYLHSSLLSNSFSSSSRGSMSSASDLEDLLSDDSALLEDNLDVFHDIPVLPGPDPFELLLVD